MTTLGLFDGNEGRIDGLPPIEGVGVARRVLARVVDIVVLQLAIGVGVAAAYLAASLLVDSLGPGTAAAIERLANASSSSWRGSWQDMALGLLGLTLLHTLCEGLHGSTIGKMVCGITVVSESGTPAGIRAGLKRSLGFLIDQLALGLVGIHKILNSPLQQRVGDEWAHTVVVRSKALAPGSRRFGLRFVAATLVALVSTAAIGFLGTAAQIRHHSGLSAQDAVEIVAVVKRQVPKASAARALRVSARVRYALTSATSGALQVFVIREGEVTPQPGRRHVPGGSGSVSLEAEVPVPPRGPGQPDPGGFRLAVGLYPERNEEAPSAHHVFDAGIVECGPGAAKGTEGDLCIG